MTTTCFISGLLYRNKRLYATRNIQYGEYLDFGKSRRHFLPMSKARGLHAARMGEKAGKKPGRDGFPGPLSHAKDEEASALYGREVCRLLYFGPTYRRTGTPVRILFTILPPDPNEPLETAESAILLLRLLHGAQLLVSDNPDKLAE